MCSQGDPLNRTNFEKFFVDPKKFKKVKEEKLIGGKESGRVAKPDTRHCVCRLTPANDDDDGLVNEEDLEHSVDVLFSC